MSPQQVILQANQAVRTGNADEAIRLYTQAIELSRGQQPVTTVAHRKMVEILFSQRSQNLALIDSHLKYLVEAGIHDDTIHDWRFRLFFAKVASESASKRQDAWASGLKVLKTVPAKWSGDTFDQFNALSDSLDSAGSPALNQVVDDLLTLTLDDATRERLMQMKNAIRLQKSFQSLSEIDAPEKGVSQALQQLVLRANQAKRTGQVAEALQLYGRVVEQSSTQPTIRVTAHREMVSLLFKQSPISREQIIRQLDELSKADKFDPDVADAKCRLLFVQLAGLAPEKRKAFWEEGIQGIVVRKGCLSAETLAELSKLVDTLGASSSLSVESVIENLSELDWQATTRTQLDELSSAIRIQNSFRKVDAASRSAGQVSMDLQRLMLKANMAKGRGQIAEAIAAYQQVLKDHPQQKEICLQAHRSLVQLLLVREAYDDSAVLLHLKALLAADGALSSEAWNYACRALLRRIGAADPSARVSLWREGLPPLAIADIRMSSETFADVDRWMAANNRNETLSVLEVLTDLLLLVPDIESMRKLQWRRIAVLTERKAWSEAICAAGLDACFSGSVMEGPRAAAVRCAEIMKSSGATTEALAAVRKRWEDGKVCGTLELGERSVDSLLRDKAKQIVSDRAVSSSLRRKAYIQLFAGQVRDSLNSGIQYLSQAVDAGKGIAHGFEDLSILLAVANGSVQSGYAFVQTLADGSPSPEVRATGTTAPATQVAPPAFQCEISPSTRKILQPAAQKMWELWRQNLIDWGAEAFREGDVDWARILWVWAINAEVQGDQAIARVNSVCDKAKGLKNAQDNLKILQAMYPCITVAEGKWQILHKIAVISYEDGQFAQCLSILDQADRIPLEKVSSKDIMTGFMRALSFIQLRKYSDAVALLSRMSDWPGTDDEHARALFLIGWVHLQENNKADALTALRKVTDWYSKTAFGPKAQELINRLEGI
jgi:tetratricopeptide (TPR) repeat protein